MDANMILAARPQREGANPAAARLKCHLGIVLLRASEVLFFSSLRLRRDS